MDELLLIIWAWLKTNWLTLVLVSASILVLNEFTRKQRDDYGRIETDPDKKRAFMAQRLIGLTIVAVGWFWKLLGRDFDGFDFDVNIPIAKIICSLVILVASTIFFFVAKSSNAPAMGQKELILRLSGMIIGTLAWVILIITGVKLWFLVLGLFGLSVMALHYFSIPIRKRGVVSIFGRVYYEFEWFMLGKEYLEAGLHFILVPWWLPGFKIILIDRTVVFFKGTTNSLPTSGTKRKGARSEDDSVVGPDITFDYECDYITGQRPEVEIGLADSQREDLQSGIKLRIDVRLKKHAMKHTIEEHLDPSQDTDIGPGLLNGVVKEVEKFVGVKILRLRILDPTPSKEYRDQAQKTAAAKSRAQELKLTGRGEGAKAAAEVEQVARMLSGIEAPDPIPVEFRQRAAQYLLERIRGGNARNIFVAPELAAVAAKVAGKI